MAELTDIVSADWQISLAEPGKVVQGLADISQCIQIILSTQKGTDPLRPEFGTDILRFMDKPASIAVPGLINEMIDAVNTWEPRVKIEKITPSIDVDTVGKFIFTVSWSTNFTTGQNQIVYG